MVVTDTHHASMVTRIKIEPPDSYSSDTDTTDNYSSCHSGRSTPVVTPTSPSSHVQAPLPMDTVILVSKSKDGSKNSLVFRSLLRNRRAAPGRVEKIRIIKTGPVTEFKNASMPMRTNLKQQLQRQQLLEQEKRDQQGAKTSHGGTGSAGIAVPRLMESTEVPTTVLQVKTELQHPTRYHVRQRQQRQVQHFLNESQGGRGSQPVHSLPTHVLSGGAGSEHHRLQLHHHPQQQQQYHVQTSSSAPEPEVPSSMLVPEFDLLSELQAVEPLELTSLLGDNDLLEIQPSLGAATRLPQTALSSPFDPETSSIQSGGAESPSSCPAGNYHHATDLATGIMSVQDELWRKERIKKDNHNMIERRRRFNINDRIKELGGLLPKTVDPDLRQNKGTILKASVDYIKSLQDDQRKLKQVQEQRKKAEQERRKLLIYISHMKERMRECGIEPPAVNDDLEISSNLHHVIIADNPSSSSSIITAPSTNNSSSGVNTLTTLTPVSSHNSSSSSQFLLNGSSGLALTNSAPPPALLQMVESEPHNFFSYNETASFMGDEFMDDSPVSGDPMLMSEPVSPEYDEMGLGQFDHFHC
ncbi:hypothetical protein EGW08_006160 [Elysia chlorotica]|uniref:BHLH domain-containing protein n=1 Tax=Elysia chlorotica TaxID=188477 RepID=A0A433TX14_ELYCH|nr:hypothetical protein EGW08_006160 [Elysia chlorotica]